ncbi:ATP-grasp domain-containing protein [Undibacterium sp. Ji49W]|uniref:ATP-grasp domain-containing protein n=1 Tax=Undibacterium sp. Ji49W TaxID=3413040 RepID=UPI003BF1750C
MIVMIVQFTKGFYHNQIKKAVEALGEECRLISWIDFDAKIIDTLSPQRDIIFMRTGTLRAVNIARNFERRGFKVLNDSRYINISGQKLLGNIYAGSNKIPVPELSVAFKKGNNAALQGYLKAYGPLVAKPIYSRDMGRFVFRISEETLEHDLEMIASIPGQEVLLQNEIKFKKIVRTIVLGRKMLVEATTYDTKHAPDWKATVCMNPNAKRYLDVPGKLIELAQWTNISFGGDIAYIDFFEKEDGSYILSEINHSCGLQHHETITGIKIHEHIAQYLLERYQQNFPTLKLDLAAGQQIKLVISNAA